MTVSPGRMSDRMAGGDRAVVGSVVCRQPARLLRSIVSSQTIPSVLLPRNEMIPGEKEQQKKLNSINDTGTGNDQQTTLQ